MMVLEIKIDSKIAINTLTSDCVRHLHELLTENASIIGADAVEPRGVKDENALERAVARQLSGAGNWLKYDNVFLNCATLIYGINKNHVFHNGNKRTSFLAMIKHLYVNGHVLRPNVRHSDIYSLILAIADKEGAIYDYAKKYSVAIQVKGTNEGNKMRKSIFNIIGKNKRKWSSDDEVKYISMWLNLNSVSKQTHPKFTIKLSELKKILNAKGIIVEQINNGKIKLYQQEERKGFLGLSTRIVNVHEKIYTLGNNKLSEVKKEIVDLIRQDFNLKISDGFDNVTFYDDESFIDEQMATYKGIIYRLSKT